MTPDEQEARSRRLSNDAIILLPLSSGALAVFNRAGELCGIEAGDLIEGTECLTLNEIKAMWHPPTKREARPNPTLEELFK